jgi:wyosine [tRNA(Phe)-imidazoG37] synthetase (radical SAM superfamily)
VTLPLSPIDSQLPAVQDHRRLYAEFAFVYPVISRRSQGLSLGVNLNPDKRCNFDCIYCEVDRNTPGRAAHLDLDRMGEELVALIRLAKTGGLAHDPRFRALPDSLTREIRDIAFSGDGEPTMIREFSVCVQRVADIKRQENLDRTKIVLITDAAGLDKADVRRGLEIMDRNQGEIWGKLDAGTEAYYRQVNRTTIRFERILRNLLETARLRPIVIQTLLLKVHGAAMPPAELDAYCERLRDLVRGGAQIKEVHAYTVARPTPETYATKLSPAELEALAAKIRSQTSLPVLAFP